jgi:hypothetical protein
MANPALSWRDRVEPTSCSERASGKPHIWRFPTAKEKVPQTLACYECQGCKRYLRTGSPTGIADFPRGPRPVAEGTRAGHPRMGPVPAGVLMSA